MNWFLFKSFCACSLNILQSLAYNASALLAMQTAVLAKGILSVYLSDCLSVRPSFRHISVFCPDEWKYDRVVFSIR